MRSLRSMPIPWLVMGHIQKVGLKFEKRKKEMQQWKNGVRGRIERKLRDTLALAGSVMEITLFSSTNGEYGLQLTNKRRLVVNLTRRTCSCRWWQLRALPCGHAMAVIEREQLSVYNYVGDCYKRSAQGIVYLNVVHPMETHDSAHVNAATGAVVGGEKLDDAYNRHILPPINPRPSGKPRVRRIESQRHGVKVQRCSKCGEEGHYRNTCRNPRADFDEGYEGDVVQFEDLFGADSFAQW